LSLTELPWADELQASIQWVRKSSFTTAHAQSVQRRLKYWEDKLSGVIGGVLANGFSQIAPWHKTVVHTTERDSSVAPGDIFPDSRCFNFDYDHFDPGQPDKHGCYLFRRSFSRMQKLRQCIVGKLDASPRWKTFSRVIRYVRQTIQGGANGFTVRDPSETDPDFASMRERFNWEQMWVNYDTIRYADEIVKNVAFKDWKQAADIRVLVDKKIATTSLTRDRKTVLNAMEVSEIRRDCFLIGDDDSLYTHLGKEATISYISLPCYQIMWDTIEVGGPPEKPLSDAISTWDPLIIDTGVVSHEYYNVLPVCARLATTLIAESTKRTKGGYSMWVPECAALTRPPRWEFCTNPSNFNCVCFQRCWEAALMQVCEEHKECCP